MGVTIHFEGKLKSEDEYEKVVDTAKFFAVTNNLDYKVFAEIDKVLQRVKDEEDWDYKGPTKGIAIQPDENSDPLNLEFDQDLYVQEFCKTQFSDISVHIIIVDFLRQIEPHFETFKVDDEGEYWDTSDFSILQEHLDKCFKAIEEAKKENTALQGPFRLDDGRIVDLMS
jgi:hypothetical protein